MISKLLCNLYIVTIIVIVVILCIQDIKNGSDGAHVQVMLDDGMMTVIMHLLITAVVPLDKGSNCVPLDDGRTSP